MASPTRGDHGGVTDHSLQLIRTARLLAEGWSERRIRSAVDSGVLERMRPGAYVLPGLPEPCRSAARLQGRVTCVSALALLGVFVLEVDGVHVHVPRTASRLPPPDGTIRRVHRRRLLRSPHPDALLVEPIDAVAEAVRCQPPRAGVATIDSALNRGVIRVDELDELFAALPVRYRPLRRLVDGRAEAGAESLVRLIARSLGCRIELQVNIDGVGRVDLLLDGWLILECDSRAFHSEWSVQRNDRRRDLEAARRGYVTFRVIAEDVFLRPDAVREALAALVRHRPSRR